MSAWQSMTIDNWCNLTLVIALMCAGCWLYMQYRKLVIDGDIKGQLVFKRMLRIFILLYILSLIYNGLCYWGIIERTWYIR